MPKSTTSDIMNLYNIEEDKEVESSFKYDQATTFMKRNNNLSSSSPANNSTSTHATHATHTTAPTGSQPHASGRFTPACFPGRTTPDFRHTTSIFEQQGTRASIVSPLTINSTELIPIAVAFNETVHAYFKMGDQHKGNGVQHTQKSKFYTKNIKNKKACFSTQSNIIYFKQK
jgi:hypothetical protein